MKEIHVRVDRSRMVDYRNCPRLRLNTYHLLGTGLKPVTPSKALLHGDLMHKVVEGLWHHEPLEALLERHLSGLAWPDRPVIELPLRCWAQLRLPRLQAEYEVVSTEQDILWEMGRQDLILPYPVRDQEEVIPAGTPIRLIIEDMIRVDALLRSREDGGLAYFELKSTNSGRAEWAKSWEHNTQVLVNTLAIEELLAERVEEVLIEGLVKSDSWAYAYVNNKTGSRRFSYAAGHTKTEIHQPAEWWPVLEESDWASACVPVPPIRPVLAQLYRKRRELVVQEVGVWMDLQLQGEALQMAFPHHDDHCRRYFNHPCAFEPLCFTKAVEEDPLGSGLYQRRTPHHVLEIASCRN